MEKEPLTAEKIEAVHEVALRAVKNAADAVALSVAWQEYLGKRGLMREVIRELKNVLPAQRASFGQKIHSVIAELEQRFKARFAEFEGAQSSHVARHELLDITVPPLPISSGRLHPITLVRREVERIFASFGFSVASGPEVEDVWHNFDALNIPPDHPARDLWDTLWLSLNNAEQYAGQDAEQRGKVRRGSAQKRVSRSSALLLRTHTSPVQIRYMQQHNPPIRIIVPGRVYRVEATDAKHDFQFWQVEGLMVSHRDDPDPVSVAHFKWIIERFFERFFKQNVSIRLRPSYFPFTEPSFEVDMSCYVCRGKGCQTCAHSGWLEMMGAGMVHPKVFDAVGYNPEDVQGFAFGMGLERLAMMRWKIPDVRLFRSGDVRFLRQF